jgi:undecaprenyl-diphosphatase
MTDFVTRAGLVFVDPDVLECLLAAAFILLPSKKLRIILPLFIFTRLFSVVLKGIFAVPLPEGVTPSYGFLGYSFPSGHVHIASIFYAWFVWSRSGPLLKALSISLLSIGMISEVVAGFHRTVDVSFALLFAWVKCWGIFKVRWSETSKLVLISISAVLLVASMFALGMNRYTDGNPYTFLSLYKILGFCACHICVKKIGLRRTAGIPMCTLGMVALFVQISDRVYINQLKWLFISAMLPVTNHILDRLVPRIQFSKRRSDNEVSFSLVLTRSGKNGTK